MATYTTQVRTICEQYAGFDESGGYDQINQAITAARASIFTANYPMYTGGSKADLETKILRHYYMREIGLETVGLWKHFLNTRMMEIMPYYCDYVKNSVNNLVPQATIELTRELVESVTGSTNTDGTTETTENGTNTEQKTDTRNMTGSSDTTYGHGVTDETTYGHGITDETTFGHTLTKSGSEETEHDSTRTPNLTKRDRYSDTPQNGITNVDQDAFLTNYRNITDSGTERTQGSDTTTFTQRADTESGKNTTVTTNSGKDTKTITNRGTDSTLTTDTGTDTIVTDGEHENTTTSTTGSSSTNEQEKTSTDTTEGIASMRDFVEIKARIMELVMNVDMMIISDLSDLFMRIY